MVLVQIAVENDAGFINFTLMSEMRSESGKASVMPSEDLDTTDRAIARELVKNPRSTDKHIREATGIALRTISRRRRRLEEEGRIRYSAEVELGSHRCAKSFSRHLYIIRFRLDISLHDVRSKVANKDTIMANTDIVYESHIAEVDGRLALLLVIEGKREAEVVESVHDKLLPRLIANHGKDAIEGISTICLLDTIRRQRNYLPGINTEGAAIQADWPSASLFVG